MSHLGINIKLKFILLIILVLISPVFANDKKITLATDPWAPYYGPDLKNNGYFTHLVSEIFKRKGYTVEVHFVPWKRALEYTKKGNYDGLLGAFYTKERLEFFEYSNAIDKTQMVFFTKKNRDITYKKLIDLSDYNIGIVRAYHYNDEFNKVKNKLRLFESVHTKDNINLLIHNRLDLFLASKKVTQSLINKHYKKNINKIKYITPAFSSNDLYISISKKRKNYKKIIADFNDGLKEIKEDGTFQRIMSSYGF